jgi:putative transposase
LAQKKSITKSVIEKRILVEPDHSSISVRRQCELIGIHRSSYYYENVAETKANTDTIENMLIMKFIDRQFIKTPTYGSRRMVDQLNLEGQTVNRKRIQRLMRLMGLQAIYPKPRLSIRNKEHKIFPYLLRNVSVERPNQVWSSDITYIPMCNGFMYLTVVMDWYSRYVLSWRLSNTLDVDFCLEALEEALSTGRPEIFNSDQGSQYTSLKFSGRLLEDGINISMDGRGRALDNVFVERLWRSVKYEDIYLKEYDTVSRLFHGLEDYFWHYNNERPHQGLAGKTPAMVYFNCKYREIA